MRTVPTISASERERLLATYPQVFEVSFMQRYGLAIGAGAALAYLLICFFAFNIGPAFMQGRWDRASVYVQDWYSWRAQPRLRFEDDGTVRAQWSSRGQYPADAAIDWSTAAHLKREGELVAAFKEKGLDIYTPDVAAFRAHVQKMYLESDLAKAWPAGMVDRINAL